MTYRLRVATRISKKTGRPAGPRMTSVKYRKLKSARIDARAIANPYDIVKVDKKGKVVKRYYR
jgi:hypothetical protein